MDFSCEPVPIELTEAEEHDSPDEPSQRGPSRKRASKACLACRARKVRCDVATRSSPCTNCYLDKQKCVVKPRRTKYRSRNEKTRSQPEPVSPLPVQHKAPGSDCPSDPSVEELVRDTASPGKPAKIEIVSDGTDDNFVGEMKEVLFKPVDTPEQIDHEARSTLDNHVMFSYYPFLKLDVMPHVSSQEVNFMDENGCFRVPTRPALDEFIQEYFLHVHPMLPIINEGDFWDTYTYRGVAPTETSRTSLFVFQAMLFAACSFVSQEAVQSLGFTSIRNARGTYYRRAKLLFDLNGEPDSALACQGALLLTYNHTVRGMKRVNSFWLGTAIHLAKDVDAHRYHAKTSLSPERQNLLKRLWWCCILRDRILPLGVRRPLQIQPQDFDFTSSPLTKGDFANEVDRSKVYDAATKDSLVELLITLCDLAVSLTDMIRVVYPLGEVFDPSGFQNEGFMSEALIQVQNCKTDLQRWLEKTTLYFPAAPAGKNTHKSISLYTNLMYMYYHCAILALYNHEVSILSASLKQGESHWDLMCQSRRKLEDGTAAITAILKELIQLKVVKYMPISIVAYASLPLVLHILDVKLSTTPSQYARKLGRLSIYTEVMKALKPQYDQSDEVTDFLERMIRTVGLQTPNQGRPSSAADDPDLLAATGESTATVSDWSDVLLRQPVLYSRLIATVDHSLCTGRFPDDADFPTHLQLKNVLANRPPLHRIEAPNPIIHFPLPPQTQSQSVHTSVLEPAANLAASPEDSSSGGQENMIDYNMCDFESSYGSVDLQEEQFRKAAGPMIADAELQMYFGLFDVVYPEQQGTPPMEESPSWADGLLQEGIL